MAEVVTMPKLSDTMEEGVIANWCKKEGEQVEEGDILAEIETDKATMDYEAPCDGVILKLAADPGSKLAVGVPIAVIGEKGESFDDKLLEVGASSAQAPAQEGKSSESTEPQKTPVKSDVIQASQGIQTTTSGSGRVKASPLAKKMAADKGIDLGQIQGSGPGGRIVQKDLESVSGSASFSGAKVRAGEDQVIANSMMRQTIAKRLHAAKNDAPHFYLTRSCDMSSLMAWRKKLNAPCEKDPSIPKVSVNDLIMLVCAKALAKHRNVNASWQGESIIEYGDVHMAMAVALPTGLITPVIRHCDQISAREIAVQSRELATRAKSGGLKPEEYQGGTFTVSNLGMLGIKNFTAIINPPQAAILAVGATAKVPWVSDKGELVVAERMEMTMSCDHRVIDGAQGAYFLDSVVSFIEDPVLML